MGLSLLSPGGTGSLPIRATLDIGPGEVLVSLALIYVLTYLYLLDSKELEPTQKRQLRTMVLTATIPLLVTFIGVLLFKSINLVL